MLNARAINYQPSTTSALSTPRVLMTNPLRVALAQINPTVGDLCANQKKILSFINDAERQQVEAAEQQHHHHEGRVARHVDAVDQGAGDQKGRVGEGEDRNAEPGIGPDPQR